MVRALDLARGLSLPVDFGKPAEPDVGNMGEAQRASRNVLDWLVLEMAAILVALYLGTL